MADKTIIIGFDMETDIGSWTSDDRGLKLGTPEILRLLRNHGVPATFLFTGRECQGNPRVVEQVLSEGHEVGAHSMYHESMGPPIFDMPGAYSVLDSEVKARLELCATVIEKVSGVRPVSFRAPRGFGSSAMVNALQELGYLVDSSLMAYYDGRDFLPYHPSSEDWTKLGDLTILELPLFYNPKGSAEGSKRGRDQWPMMRLKGSAWFGDLCLRLLDEVKDDKGRSVLCMYIHPWEFVEMPRTLHTDEATIHLNAFLHKGTGAYQSEALDEFLGLMKDQGVAFARMRDLAASW